VQPVDAVKALDDADAALPEVKQARQVTGGTGEQHGIEGGFIKAVADLDAAGMKAGGQFGLEGGNTASIGRVREDTNTWHEGIIP
jgi:autotransporter adhesin